MFKIYYCGVLICVSNDYTLFVVFRDIIQSLFVAGFLDVGFDSVYVVFGDDEGGED